MLRSWAVPRGLPSDSADNRLAVEVSDHDLEHLTYEDEDKAIADIGWWEEHDRNERRMVFTLHGRHDTGRYALIRTSRDGCCVAAKDESAVDAGAVSVRSRCPAARCRRAAAARSRAGSGHRGGSSGEFVARAVRGVAFLDEDADRLIDVGVRGQPADPAGSAPLRPTVR